MEVAVYMQTISIGINSTYSPFSRQGGKVRWHCLDRMISSLVWVPSKGYECLQGSSCALSHVTADERQPWTNYENNGNEYFTIGAVVRSE